MPEPMRTAPLIALAVLGAAALAGCAPPRPALVPWAREAIETSPPETPRVQAEWDGELQAYVVSDRPCHFLRTGRLYRHLGEGWQQAPTLAGPWREIYRSGLPRGFRWRRAEARCAEAPRRRASSGRESVEESLP